MPTVKYSVSAYIADGTTTDYLITWDYLDDDHITVYVEGTSNSDPTSNHTFTKLNNTTLRITDGVGGAITSGSEIEIRRETPLSNRAITFADGSALLAEDLNKNSDYLLYSMQEVLDTVESAAQDGARQAQTEAELNRDETIVLKNTTAGYLATVQADATDADNHRIAAAASEAAAALSETNAATSETNAATSETNAAASEAAAAASETAAETAEIGAVAAQTGVSAAQTAAELAQTNAETAETNAANSAAAAASSESSVAANATAAGNSETAAALSATNASTSETNASNSAAAASTSETNAASSATNSQASAVNAATSETNAATSETNASNSATAASTSETNAATSETNAASSAANASQNETNAEVAWGSFDARYLGAKSTAPSIANDGDPLIEGALYWNTTDSVMYVYTNGGWGVTQSGLAAVATSGDYNDLVNVPPSTASSIVKYASDPSGASEGDVYYNTVNDNIRFFDGLAWVSISNSPPTSTGGTIVLNSQDMETSFSYDFSAEFNDVEDGIIDLVFTESGLPSGLSMPSQGNTTITGTLPAVSGDTQYNFTVTATDTDGASAAQNYQITVTEVTDVVGEATFSSAGTYSWIAPAGVTEVKAVAVGGGGSGGHYFGWGGGGGGLGWKNTISVIPGNAYTVVVGAGGTGNSEALQGEASTYEPGSTAAANGKDSFFISSGTVAGFGGMHGGGNSNTSSDSSRAFGGSYVGDGGGNGGAGWGPYNTSFGVNYLSSGGGGAGGYSGNGGNGAGSNGSQDGAWVEATSGSGGGGGGASSRFVDTAVTSLGGAGGGGVGLLGLGTSGASGTFNSTTTPATQVNETKGLGGSGGSDGFISTTANTGGGGGLYGGGGGSSHGDSAQSVAGAGGSGAVRIIWGINRSFPNNAT